MLFVQLNPTCLVQLDVTQEAVIKQCRYIFDGWLADREHVSSQEVSIVFSIEMRPKLPRPPAQPPYFIDTRVDSAHQYGTLHTYRCDDADVFLYFYGGAVVKLHWSDRHTLSATAYVTPDMVDGPRFEDLIFTSLAPLLRRKGIYLLHAFAAAYPHANSDKVDAALIVGPSHSGKTTTGLNLILNGWRLLANDVIMLGKQDGLISAWPSPGIVSVRPFSFQLLPQLARFVRQLPDDDVSFSSFKLGGGKHVGSASVRHIFFPEIQSDGQTHMTPIPTGVAMAHLLEESLDNWDPDTLPAHSLFLSQLAQQCACTQLRLGRDVHQLPSLLSQAMI